MTIYIDDTVYYPQCPWRWKEWCHMMTDQDDLTELHIMAEKLGIRKYFQDHARHPHYDLIPSKRKLAKKFGAVETDSITMVNLCSKVRN